MTDSSDFNEIEPTEFYMAILYILEERVVAEVIRRLPFNP